MNAKRPFIITLIGDLYIFTAILTILSLFSFSRQLGLMVYSMPYYFDFPILLKNVLIILYAIIQLIISYGFLKLKSWGYWSAICYNILSLVGWIVLIKQNKPPISPQNLLTIIIGMIFTIPTIRYFNRIKTIL